MLSPTQNEGPRNRVCGVAPWSVWCGEIQKPVPSHALSLTVKTKPRASHGARICTAAAERVPLQDEAARRKRNMPIGQCMAITYTGCAVPHAPGRRPPSTLAMAGTFHPQPHDEQTRALPTVATELLGSRKGHTARCTVRRQHNCHAPIGQCMVIKYTGCAVPHAPRRTPSTPPAPPQPHEDHRQDSDSICR